MPLCLDAFLQSGMIMSVAQDQFLIGWGEPTFTKFNCVDLSKPYFYLNDFFLSSSNPWIQFSSWAEVSSQQLKDYLGPEVSFSTSQWLISKPQQFQKAFEALLLDFKDNRLKKAVPYLFAKSCSAMTNERLCRSLRKGMVSVENKAGYLYGYWKGNEGILGITPELLFSHTQKFPKNVKTMAVAGTCHSSQDQKVFFQNIKERHEHDLVIQGICHSLQTLGSIHVGALQLLRLPKLMHLMTPIELELSKDFQYETLVKHLHPTPALGAFPVKEGRQWLEDYEKHIPRRYYGAPLGFCYPEQGISYCFVAIRNVQWDASGMRIGAGCGVVKQSSFEKEWKEIQIKIRAIRELLNL